jgi:hypothetical protein
MSFSRSPALIFLCCQKGSSVSPHHIMLHLPRSCRSGDPLASNLVLLGLSLWLFSFLWCLLLACHLDPGIPRLLLQAHLSSPSTFSFLIMSFISTEPLCQRFSDF